MDSYDDYEGMWSDEGDLLKVGIYDSNFENIISYFMVNINYPTQESIQFNFFIDTVWEIKKLNLYHLCLDLIDLNLDFLKLYHIFLNGKKKFRRLQTLLHNDA